MLGGPSRYPKLTDSWGIYYSVPAFNPWRTLSTEDIPNMNKLAKVGPIFVILACLGSLVLAFKISQMKNRQTADISRLNDTVSETNRRLAKTEKDFRDTQSKLTVAQNERTAAEASLTAANVALTNKTQETEALRMQIADNAQQLQAATNELAKAKDAVNKINESFQAAGIKGLENFEEIREKIVTLSQENTVLGEQLNRLRDQNQQLQEQVTELSTTPVNLRGRVAAVNANWGFVVLNVGHNERVQPKAQFVLYRDSKMIAKTQVVSVGANTSIAEILPEYRRSSPRPGDLAIH
jgi:predicted  nucleic acid-binding Zn-ribbon protein